MRKIVNKGREMKVNQNTPTMEEVSALANSIASQVKAKVRYLPKPSKNGKIKTKPAKEVNYAFPVTLVPLKTPQGITVPSRAVYRYDLKKVIGIVGPDYKIIKHEDVLSQIEENLPIIISTRKIELNKGGAYLFANYESNKIEPVEPRKGDIVKFGIQIFNSYNGHMPVGMRLYALRLACLNGMTVPKSISTLQVRHIAGSNIIEAKEQFLKKIEQFKTQSIVWKQWTQKKAKQAHIDTFLKTYLNKGARDIIENKFKIEQDDSMWGFFNAITWYGTHILQSRGLKVDDKERDVKKIKDLAKRQFDYDREIVEKFYKYNWN